MARDLMSTARAETSAARRPDGPSDRERSRSAEPGTAIDVLVVDDDEDDREALESAIESLGYPVRVARNGAEALAEQQRRPAAIILTDWSMPGMTGLELCVALKRLEPQPHVVMMTGFD